MIILQLYHLSKVIVIKHPEAVCKLKYIVLCSAFFHQQQMHGTLTFLLIPSTQIKPAPHRQTVVSL